MRIQETGPSDFRDRRILAPRWLFRDRVDAGRQLASRLAGYRAERPIILALPRGGVPVAAEVAEALNATLDVLPVRKIGVPGHRELGVGAIALGGASVLDVDTIRKLGISNSQLTAIVSEELAELERQRRRFRDDEPLPDLRDRTVILVDDGLATGVSARAAIRAARALGPRRVVLAVPVCAPETASEMRQEVDDLVCVASPPDFYAVGLWYRDFSQTTDETVVELLKSANERCRALVTGANERTGK